MLAGEIIGTGIIAWLILICYGDVPNCPSIGICPYPDPVEHTVHLAHKTECKLFCRCDKGVAKIYFCPDGLHFNPVLQICDLPESAGCTSSGKNLSITSPDEMETSTKKYVTQPPFNKTIEIQNQHCPAKGFCPFPDPYNHTLLPHYSNCSLFCQCFLGTPRLKTCPNGLHFNAKLQICDWPCHAGCEDENTGTSPLTSKTTDITRTSLIYESTSISTKPEEECPTFGTCPFPDPLAHTVHLPHLTDCTLFCRCDHGKPKLDRCPDGLHFNPNLQVCDWPEYAGCNSTGGEGGGESETTLSQEATTSLITNPSQETTTSVTAELPEKDCPIIGKCPLLDPLDHTVHLPHLTNCTLFCRCDHGKPKLDHCPDGLHFNPNLQVCDWPEYAACNSTGGEEVGETTLSQEVTPSLRTSPEYETTTSVTAELPEEDCPTRGKCPLPDPLDHTVHLPHLTNCTLFCRCDHGKPKIYQCPDGLHFNPILQVCDWPEYAGCNSTGGEEVGETTLSQEVTPSLRTSPEHETTTSVTAELPEEDCPTRGKCPFPDPLDHTVHLPHLTNCTLFCRCDHGKPKLDRCPDGLYFNPNLQVCDWLQNAGCSSTGGEGGG